MGDGKDTASKLNLFGSRKICVAGKSVSIGIVEEKRQFGYLDSISWATSGCPWVGTHDLSLDNNLSLRYANGAGEARESRIK